MRWTQFFIPTAKEAPKDAVVASHQLMLRAGLIRQLAAGVYSYLPMGYRSLRKVEQIVREEMNRAGAIELHLPVLHPIELWEQTGRTLAMGDTLLRLAGPADDWRSHTVLGPTHEEPITEIARAYLNSYKMLPVNFYQIQVKFRGEARPKSGVLRTREFLMKDAYSFHRDKASLDEGYQKMYDAYCRIFERCGLPYVVVEAESGPIGGDASHEFMVRTDAGEDVLVRCVKCNYAANTERAVAAAIPQSDSGMESMREVHTPAQRTIDEVTAFLGTKPQQMIKTLIYRAAGSGVSGDADQSRDRKDQSRDREDQSRDRKEAVPHSAPSTHDSAPAFMVLVRGDHEVNENKLNRVAGVKLELADEETIRKVTGAPVGFAGPHAVHKSAQPVRLIVDQAVAAMRNGVSGANKAGYHAAGINPGRDFPLESVAPVSNRESVAPVSNRWSVVIADVRTVAAGDRCPRCGGDLVFEKCIEVGHVFKLGTKYSDALEATFLDQDGKPKPFIMGCYGIGVNRIMAAAIEAHHDAGGIIWPISIAPFEVLIVALDPREQAVMDTAAQIHDELQAAGIDVLFDDRDERAGFKFKDADLIGIPIRITIGRKSLADGVVELKRRDAADIEKLPPQGIAPKVTELVRSARM